MQEDIDRQHGALLHQCDVLGRSCDDPAAFDTALAQLKALAEAHFRLECELLPERAEDLQAERSEFEHLLAEVATTRHFDRAEVQRFVALWWLGHVRGMAEGAR